MQENVAKVKWNQHPIEDDIAFRGPLSYLHFKIIGWLLFVVQMIIPPIKLAASADPGLGEMLTGPLSVMELIAPLSVIFLLVADFAQLIVVKDYKKQLIVNGVTALAVIVVFEFLYHRYIVGCVDAFVRNRIESLEICDAVFSSLNPAGFLACNVFIDLFLCTSVMFFINYEPTKYLTGENRKWFQALAILPMVFELGCLWLKLEAHSGDFHVPISIFPFLTTKPPMMFFAFCVLVFYQTKHEERFRAGGRTHEEYLAYLGTNRNNWRFAKTATVIFLIAGIIDAIVVVVSLSGDLDANLSYLSTLPKAERAQWFYDVIDKYANAGFGGAVDLLFFAPLMLLFNHTKSYKNEYIDYAIPVGAVILLTVLYLEGGLLFVEALSDITRNEILPAIEEVVEQVEKVEKGDVSELIKYLESTQKENEKGSEGSGEASVSESAQKDAPATAPSRAYAEQHGVSTNDASTDVADKASKKTPSGESDETPADESSQGDATAMAPSRAYALRHSDTSRDGAEGESSDAGEKKGQSGDSTGVSTSRSTQPGPSAKTSSSEEEAVQESVPASKVPEKAAA